MSLGDILIFQKYGDAFTVLGFVGYGVFKLGFYLGRESAIPLRV